MTTQNNNQNKPKTLIAEAVGNSLLKTNGKEGLFVMIPVSVTGASSKRTISSLKQVTEDGVDVSNNKKVSNPSIEFIDSKTIAFAGRYRDSVIHMFRRCGFNLGNGLYLIEEKHLETVYKEMLGYKKDFDGDVLAFLDEYQDHLEMQSLLNPSIAKEIKQYAPTRAHIAKSFRFRIGVPQALQVKSTFNNIDKLLVDAGESIDPTAHFIEPIIESIAADMTHFWRYNLRSIRSAIEDTGKREGFTNPLNKRNGIKGTFMTILKCMKEKISDLYSIEPRLKLLADEVDNVVNMIPNGYNRDPKSVFSDYDVSVKLNEMASRLMDPAYIQGLINLSPTDQACIDDTNFIAQAMEQESASQCDTVEVAESVDVSLLFKNFDLVEAEATVASTTVDTSFIDSGLAAASTSLEANAGLVETIVDTSFIDGNLEAANKQFEAEINLDLDLGNTNSEMKTTSNDSSVQINFSTFDETEVEVTNNPVTETPVATTNPPVIKEAQIQTYETLETLDLNSLFANFS